MSISAKFRRSIKPLIIINSIFTTGLMEYFVDDKINVIAMVYACFSIIIYLTMTYVLSFTSFILKYKQPFIPPLAYTLYTCNSHLSHIGTIVAGVLRRKKVRRLTLQIETCIRIMEQLDIPMDLSKYFWQQLYVILFFVLILITMIVIDYHWLITFNANTYWIIFVYFYLARYPIIGLLVVDITFVFWMRYVKIKFCQLNELLKGMLMSTIDTPQHKRVLQSWINGMNDSPSSDTQRKIISNKDVIRIYKAREIHLELIKCARNINEAYNLHTLISISITFILSIIVASNAYYFVITMNYNMELLQSFTFLFWILYCFFSVIIISHVCSRTVTEIRDFTLQLIQNPLTFTSCGFFDLNHTLIRRMIVIVTTYLFIFIQFGGKPSKKVFFENSTLSTTNDL